MFTFFFPYVLTGHLYILFCIKKYMALQVFCPFLFGLLPFYCWVVESVGYSCMHSSLDSQFYSTGLVYISVLTPIRYCFDFFSFLVSFEIRDYDFLLFQFCFSYLESLKFIYEFVNWIFWFWKKYGHYRFDSNHFESIDHIEFLILNLLINEHRIYFHCFMSF